MKKTLFVILGLALVAGVVFLVKQDSASSETDMKDQEAPAVVDRSTHAEKSPSQHPSSDEISSTTSSKDTDLTNLSDSVLTLLGQDGEKHNYATLLKAISELDTQLSQADVSALMQLLEFPNERFPEKMRSVEINAIKNDVLDKLLKQQTLPEGLDQQMVDMAGNTKNDPVWRDYCVQFMTPLYERLAEEEPADSESSSSKERLGTVRDAMFLALGERDNTLAGTALIGLENLSRTHEEFDRELISAKAVEIASDEAASAESRLSALRLSASLGSDSPTTVETARMLAQTGETVYMRSAAIVTLGEVGTEDDRELLDSFALSDDRQVALAAKMALSKMDARN